jgi:hypothetical protein
VDDRQRPREVGDEDQRGLQRGDEDRLEPVVVDRDLGAQLLDPLVDLVGGEVDVADALVEGRRQEARSSLYRWARRSMSRR